MVTRRMSPTEWWDAVLAEANGQITRQIDPDGVYNALDIPLDRLMDIRNRAWMRLEPISTTAERIVRALRAEIAAARKAVS